MPLVDKQSTLQAAVGQLLERNPVMAGDCREADMDFVLVVLSTEIDYGSAFWQRAEPILELDNALAAPA